MANGERLFLPDILRLHLGVCGNQPHICDMRFLLAILVPLTLLGGCVTPTTDPARLPAGQWSLDEGHTSVTWQVRHYGLSWYTARFDGITASLDFDPASPEAAAMTAIIDAASVSTGDPAFDAELASDWFNADDHSQIVFRSTSITVTGETTGRATGVLSMNGREGAAVMDIVFHGGVFNLLEGRNAIGFSAEMAIDRTQWGIGSLPASIVGEEVRILIEAEFLREGDNDE